MNTLFITFIALLICCVYADPLPNGGKPCNESFQCGDGTTIGGTCMQNGSMMVCYCNNEYGNPDCTYHRQSSSVVGGLQIGLVFIGINGVGNFMLGKIPHAVGQLVMGLACYIIIIFISCILCCGAFGGNSGLVASGVVSGILGCLVCLATLAGMIWTIVDGVFILQGLVTDENGYNTY